MVALFHGKDKTSLEYTTISVTFSNGGFSNQALMSSSHCLWHIAYRVLARGYFRSWPTPAERQHQSRGTA